MSKYTVFTLDAKIIQEIMSTKSQHNRAVSSANIQQVQVKLYNRKDSSF